ncbi:MAG: tape measure protein, partial [Bacteroides sp.]
SSLVGEQKLQSEIEKTASIQKQTSDVAAANSAKLGEARDKASSLVGEQKLQSEIEKTASIQKQTSDKSEISLVKLGEAREHAAASSLIGEQRLQTEIEKTAAIQGKSAAEISSIQKQSADKAAIAQSRIATESQKLSAIQMAAADKSRVSVSSLMAMERERAAKQAIYQQKLATEFQRTEAARSRAQLAMVTGERNANNAIGMTNKTMFSQKELLRQLSNAAGIYFSIYQVGAFVKNLAMVSGEFEMQRISLENILQDAEAADKLFGQIKGLAVVSPFEFKDLVGYAKQLSAFSIPVNELYDTTKRLADISAGLGVDMGRIILAYGQVRSASVLRGQELRQFTEAGIPLVDELAKKFGELEGRVVSAGEVFDKISNRL